MVTNISLYGCLFINTWLSEHGEKYWSTHGWRGIGGSSLYPNHVYHYWVSLEIRLWKSFRCFSGWFLLVSFLSIYRLKSPIILFLSNPKEIFLFSLPWYLTNGTIFTHLAHSFLHLCINILLVFLLSFWLFLCLFKVYPFLLPLNFTVFWGLVLISFLIFHLT